MKQGFFAVAIALTTMMSAPRTFAQPPSRTSGRLHSYRAAHATAAAHEASIYRSEMAAHERGLDGRTSSRQLTRGDAARLASRATQRRTAAHTRVAARLRSEVELATDPLEAALLERAADLHEAALTDANHATLDALVDTSRRAQIATASVDAYRREQTSSAGMVANDELRGAIASAQTHLAELVHARAFDDRFPARVTLRNGRTTRPLVIVLARAKLGREALDRQALVTAGLSHKSIDRMIAFVSRAE